MVDFDLALKETEIESSSREIVGNDLEAAKFNLYATARTWRV